MPMVTPSLNLPTPSTSSSASMKPPGLMPPPALPAAPTLPSLPSPPSTTVTLSSQGMSLASGHSSSSPSSSASGTSSPGPAPAAEGGSIYDSLKNGIAAAIDDVGDAIAGGAHAIVSGVETALSTANNVAVGIVELPFAAVAKTADAAGALIDEL